MNCASFREAISGHLDGESLGLEPRLLDRHLGTCSTCRRYARRAAELHGATRVRQAEPVPDLSAAIQATLTRRRSNPHDPVLGWLRSGLTFVGVLVVALSTALLLTDTVENQAHLAAWDLAFGGALLVAAWQPARARGLVPIAVLMALSMTAAGLVERSDGHPATHGLVFHSAELAGVVLLMLLARHARPYRRAGLPPT